MRRPALNRCDASKTDVLSLEQFCCSLCLVTSNQLKRWLAQHGCTFEPGHGGHLLIRRGELMSVLPMHGSGKELGTGLVHKIKKDPGLQDRQYAGISRSGNERA